MIFVLKGVTEQMKETMCEGFVLLLMLVHSLYEKESLIEKVLRHNYVWILGIKCMDYGSWSEEIGSINISWFERERVGLRSAFPNACVSFLGVYFWMGHALFNLYYFIPA